MKTGSQFRAGELSLRWNQVWPSILNTYRKLKELGYIYSQGEVYIINKDEMEKA